MLSPNIQELGSASPNGEALTLVNDVPEMQSPDKIAKSIKESKKIDWKAVSVRALSFSAATALGVLTGLTILGAMVTPVGWAIAGGALLIGLVGSIACGGLDEFLTVLKHSVSVFLLGAAFGTIGSGKFLSSRLAGLSLMWTISTSSEI